MKGYEGKGSITVKNTSAKDIILSAFSTSEGMSINIKNNVTLKSQGSLSLTAKLTPKNKGYFNGYIHFNTNHPDFPVMDIVCYGNCK
jgi:ABC-type transport system substrate-binding protein